MAALYLIPNTLGESPLDAVIPSANVEIVRQIKHFIVEDIRTARRFLKKNDRAIDIETLTFYELNKHTDPKQVADYLAPLAQGLDVGVISEAGCPGVADPGADVVWLAHQAGHVVRPLVGPSSIVMSLMASGLNGQNFAFVGYLPIAKPERAKRIKQLEGRAVAEKQAQIFIEAPYRNLQLWDDLVANCNPQTLLCVAANISLENEFIVTQTVAKWKNRRPNIDKQPTIFLLGTR